MRISLQKNITKPIFFFPEFPESVLKPIVLSSIQKTVRRTTRTSTSPNHFSFSTGSSKLCFLFTLFWFMLFCFFVCYSQAVRTLLILSLGVCKCVLVCFGVVFDIFVVLFYLCMLVCYDGVLFSSYGFDLFFIVCLFWWFWSRVWYIYGFVLSLHVGLLWWGAI